MRTGFLVAVLCIILAVGDPIEKDTKSKVVSSKNVFLHYILEKVTSANDIVHFTGPVVKNALDLKNSMPHLSLSEKHTFIMGDPSNERPLYIRHWSRVAELINKTHAVASSTNGTLRAVPFNRAAVGAGDLSLVAPTRHDGDAKDGFAAVEIYPKAVHVHNEHKLGDLLLLVISEHYRSLAEPKTTTNNTDNDINISSEARKKETRATRRNGGKNRAADKIPKGVAPLTRAQMHRALDRGQPPIVMTTTVDENWGFFSTAIGTRTTKWLNMTNHLRIHNADYSVVRSFLDSSKVVLVLCNTHVDPMIGAHTKILALPLGTKARPAIFARAAAFAEQGVEKKRLLTINNSGWGDRTNINAFVAKAFNYTVRNTYSKKRRNAVPPLQQKHGGMRLPEDHHLEIAESKFVLCPSGLGFDTYRLWETLMMGSIPIVESNAGLDRSYSNLPVLVIRSYELLTPELLESVYPCFVQHADDFRYDHLTMSYWMKLIQTAVLLGSVQHVTKNHPFRNKYCDFLDLERAASFGLL